MSEALERHHSAEEAVGGGAKRAALLIAAAAALLALCEQGAKHAELRMSQSALSATDLWAQYQAKSVRSTLSQDLADLAALPELSGPTAERRDALVARMQADVRRFDHAPQDGREALAERAHTLEERRDHSHEVLESFDNASAALQLSIVLATASVITAAAPLLWASLVLTAAGALLGVLGLVAPTVGAMF